MPLERERLDAWRQRGYTDATAGRPRKRTGFPSAGAKTAYTTSFRRGLEARATREEGAE